jgi:hypothetical protein
VRRHAVPRTAVTVLDQRLPLRLAKRSPSSPRTRALPQLVRPGYVVHHITAWDDHQQHVAHGAPLLLGHQKRSSAGRTVDDLSRRDSAIFPRRAPALLRRMSARPLRGGGRPNAIVRDRRGSRAGLRVITPERILVRSAKENLGEVLSVGEQWGSHDRLGPSDGDRVRPRVYGSLGGYALRFARRWMAG